MEKKKKTIVLVIIIALILLILGIFVLREKKYDVSFSGASGLSNIEVKSGRIVKKPADPVKEGYKFAGWYCDGVLFDFDQKITKDIKLEARWEKIDEPDKQKKYKVTFNNDDGTTIDVLEVNSSGVVLKPVDPVKEGYKFLGWYNGNTLYDFNTSIKEDITLIAKYEKEEEKQEEPTAIKYTVTFNSDGGSAVKAQTIEENNKATKPSNPTKSGYKFISWQLDGKDYNFGTKVTKDITLKATWEKLITYTVTFNSDGGSSVKSQTVEKDKTATKPSNPTKSGYKFINWQLDGNDYNFGSKVTKNITLKAVWKKLETYTVTFDSNGGSAISSKQVTEGSKLTKPSNPTKEGYNFNGWTLNGTAYDFNKAVTGNIKLIASWKQKNYTYTYSYVDPVTPADVKITVYEEGKAISFNALYVGSVRLCGNAGITNVNNISKLNSLKVELSSGVKVDAVKK